MNIYEKLAKIQNQLKAPKSEFNKFAKYHYRTAENILKAVKPIAKENECVIVITDTIEEKGGRFFIHSIAELISFDFVPNAEGEPKVTNASGWAEIPNNKGMDEAQQCGTASSYARKYALGGLLGITNEKDSDAVASEQAEQDAKEQAIKENEAKLNANEKWRLVGKTAEIKCDDGKFYPLTMFNVGQLKAVLSKEEFADIKYIVQTELDKRQAE